MINVHPRPRRFKFAAWLILTLMILSPSQSMATETPRYSVLRADGDFEIRQYEPRIIAEVSASGNLDAASAEGFRTLASYIFGNNRVAPGQAATVSADESTKIAMTAPVTIEPIKPDQSFASSGDWRVEFTMPSGYSLATLPTPNNPSIKIREIPPRIYAVVRYSGLNTDRRINDELIRLLDWARSQNLSVRGAPELARYNPPWTLPIFRRNEILLPIGDHSKQ
jgi:DNA gyrase inhibitor GyrI